MGGNLGTERQSEPGRANMSTKRFRQDALKVHNELRAKHGCPALKHSKDCTAVAQKWADHIASRDIFQHSSDRTVKGEQMGENISMKWTSTGEDFTGREVTEQWYSEIERYDFAKGSGPRTGHFTQVVWKGSREFGIGKAQTKDGKWLVVANYFPAGNFIGRFHENVPPPKGGNIYIAPTEPSSKSGAVAAPRLTQTQTHSVSQAQTRTVTKRFVTETTIGPDGKKTTVTREIVTDTSGQEVPPPPQYWTTSRTERTFAPILTTKTTVKSDKGAKPQRSEFKAEKAAKPQKMKDFIEDAVKIHNKYRKAHQVVDIKHNKDISALSQSWAEKLAADGRLAHSNASYKGEELGENCASKFGSGGSDYTGEEVVNQWYSEHPKYDWRVGDFQQGTGHFSQVVWKGSKEFGIGKAFGKDGRVVVVANYYPAGNVLGKFKENVFPKK